MTSGIGDTFRSLWHTFTSRDRHSSHDSPFRTGRLVPHDARNNLATVVTSSEYSTGLNDFYSDEHGRALYYSSDRLNIPVSPYTVPNLSHPSTPVRGQAYAPGLRSSVAAASQNSIGGLEHDPMASTSSGGIPMQSFQDGLAPPPPVAHSWSKIDNWAREHYPELFDQLCEGATRTDMNELELQLDCTLPQDVRDSLMFHDGQERGGTPTGIVFGSMLLDCEEITQEWETWRRVALDFGLDPTTLQDPSRSLDRPAVPSRTLAMPSSSKAPPSSPVPSPSVDFRNNSPAPWRQELMMRQTCVPPGAVARAYAHPAWIPLVRDWGGNNLAVDLAPGPTGRWGQIILFGRDYDTKYVVARSWAAFLALLADDLNSGKWFVDEDTNELKLREFREARVDPSYFSILRWRMDQKYGRRSTTMAKRRSMMPAARGAMGSHRAGSATSSLSGSPYPSPTQSVVGSPSSAAPVAGLALLSLQKPSPLSLPKPSPLSRLPDQAARQEQTLGSRRVAQSLEARAGS